MASDVWLFNLEDKTSKQITDFEGTDSLPMWHKNKVYYLSDAGDEHRLNIWSLRYQIGRARTDHGVFRLRLQVAVDGSGHRRGRRNRFLQRFQSFTCLT